MKIRHLQIENFRGIKSLSWRVQGDFNCIIGPGDACKTTILTAIDYALSPRTFLSIDDSDFFNQNVDAEILIQITLADWDESQPEIRKFFSENKFGQYKCGLDEDRLLLEPQPGGTEALSVSLRVDKTLEPRWSVVRGKDEDPEQERKPIGAGDRAILGVSRIDAFSDFHFTWGRNTILTRLSSGSQGNLNAILSELARYTQQTDISSHQSIADCERIATSIQEEAKSIGVKVQSLVPKIDIQRQSISAGALSLHDEKVPLRGKGAGTKKLLSIAMQIMLYEGKNVSLIDEIETGLEPHRIRGLIYNLKNSGQQIFTTTHSPVVLRELNVSGHELYLCKKTPDSIVTLESLGSIPDVQGAVRSNAEAFLGSKVIVCEGLTEIGCLRAYDVFRLNGNKPPVWSLATAYFNCGGESKIKPVCSKLSELGYKTAVLCDNDSTEHLNAQDISDLQKEGIQVCQWEEGNSIEKQLFQDIPWGHVPDLLKKISETHDTLEHSTVLNEIKNLPDLSSLHLSESPDHWQGSPLLRQKIGEMANKSKWIKRIDYATSIFEFALPLLPEDSIIKTKLGVLWDWVQND